MEQRFNLGAVSSAGTAAADTLGSSGVHGKMNFSRRRLFYTIFDEVGSLVPPTSVPRSSSPPSQPPPPPPEDNSSDADPSASGFETLDPNVVIIMVVLLFALICAAFLNSIMRCLLRRAHNRRVAAPAGGAGRGDLSAVQGLDSKTLACLPVLTFKPAEKPKEFAADCTICLCEFTENEKLRLLPKCSHVFHLDCIDMWLLCHITCPVCRDGIGDDDHDSSSVGLAVYEEDVARGGMILTRDQDGHPSVTTADGGGGAGGAEMVLIRDPEAQSSGSTRAILGTDETECLRAELLRNRSVASSTDDSALRLPSRDGSSSRRTLRAAFSSIFTADNFFSGRWQASSSSSSSSAPVAPLAIAAAPPSISTSAVATTATSISSAR